MQRNRVNLYKDGDNFGIESSCDNKDFFLDEIAEELSELIDSEKFKDDWQFQLRGWMPHIIDIYNCHDRNSGKSNMTIGSGDTYDVHLVKRIG
jgi:hypothetical protein